MSEDSKPPKIVVAGAGSVGCFVGGVIASKGGDVRFLARSRIASMLLTHGLTVTDLDGMHQRIAVNDLKLSTDPTILAGADIILVTTKSDATTEIADLIKQFAQPSAKVVSLQNGVRNAETLRTQLPGYDVRAGVVPFNVITAGDGRFHRGVEGKIAIEAGDGDLAATLTTPSLRFYESDAIANIQWGKLLINLNNALNALSGLPLREQLLDRAWRRVFADQIREALPALNAKGIKPISPFPVPFALFATLLNLPTRIYKIIAATSLRVDPKARSSMWEDLQRRRKTEIDELQGAVIAICEEGGFSSALNQRVLSHIRAAETVNAGSPALTPEAVRNPETVRGEDNTPGSDDAPAETVLEKDDAADV